MEEAGCPEGAIRRVIQERFLVNRDGPEAEESPPCGFGN
jgi:hypothetical protein